MNTDIIKEVVKHFGGQREVAEICGVTQPSVSYWLSGKRGMSAKAAVRIEAASKGLFKKEVLCPEVFVFLLPGDASPPAQRG